MIRVTENIHIEIDIPKADAKGLLRDIKGHDAVPSQVTLDLVALLEKKLSPGTEGPVYREKS